ncbi:hypothetical protein ACHHYP_11542 [Achlya hypogyna]|uniref:Transmembrane protein n=1 Tax=Achlya hypogyna TaxID=1202772 RepID=A0A1V9YIX3_ACHHY|nr:hypothetical protein ACHHYP_11542 [Achlya hypogyna]
MATIAAVQAEPMDKSGTSGPPRRLSAVTRMSRSNSVRARHFTVLERCVQLLDILVNIYSIIAFVMTSSIFDLVLMRQGVFMDDVTNGVYDFSPVTPNDRLILNLMHNASAGQSKYIGIATGAMGAGGTSSWCVRINNTLGVAFHAIYNGDNISRRFLRYAHTELPTSCSGWTVAPGGNWNDTRITAVDDARRSFGQSYLHCSDPRYYTPVFNRAGNLSSFRFRTGYIVAQQHHAGGVYGIVTHLSTCTAVKLADSVIYKVEPYPTTDTTDEVNVLFTNKNAVLWLLDFGGQALVIVVLLNEVFRSSFWLVTHIPTTSYSRYKEFVDVLCARTHLYAPTFNGGVGTMSLSQIWLVNPWYLIGNCMYGLGTTSETQMLVEILYYNWTVQGDVGYFVKGAMYAMRHAWVSIGVWTCIRIAVTSVRLPYCVHGVLLQVRLVEMYCSCRTLVFAFMLASLIATRTRGVFYLTNRVNVVDEAGGWYKGSFSASEDLQSLLVIHGLALIFDVVLAFLSRALLSWACPNHRRNSFFRAIDRHRVCSGFDLARLITGSRSIVVGHHCVLLMPLADLYLVYSSVNLWSSTSMPGLPSVAPGNAIEFVTNDDGTVLSTKDSGVHVPELATLQGGSATAAIYCAVV